MGRRLAWWLGGTLAAVSLLVAVAWGVLLFQILPRVDVWRVDLAEQATRALGVTVRIGRVEGRADGIWPVLTLHQVQLLDTRGQVGLSLPEVSARVSLATLSPQALWSGEVRLDRLTLVRPELDVRRDRAGGIHVAGLELAARPNAPSDGSAGTDWVLSQPSIQIQGGTVRWTDELRAAPPLALQHVELALRNGWGLGRRRHDLMLSATPPAEFGRRFELAMRMTQPLWAAPAHGAGGAGTAPGWWQQWRWGLTRPSEWQTWSGALQATLPFVDVQRFKRHVTLPVDVQGGRGAVQLEVTLARGEPSEVRLRTDVQDVQVRLVPELAPLAFRQLKGTVEVKHQSRSTSLAFQGLSFTLADGLNWPVSSGRFEWQHAPWPGGWTQANWGSTLGGTVQAERLDLALLAQIADRLPLAPALRAGLADLAPQGVVSNLAGRWEGALDDPRHYRVSAKVTGLGLAESVASGRPGLQGADVQVTADENGGRADLAVRGGWLAFPGVFDEARVPMDALQAKVQWAVRVTDGAQAAWDVRVADATFANEDARGVVSGTWRAGGRNGPALPGALTLSGRLERAEANRVWRYLPSSIPASARNYVHEAIRGGRGEGVTFEVQGKLVDFPFKNDVGGRFRVRVPVRDVTLEYVPRSLLELPAGAQTGFWPAFSGLDGLLVFEGQRLLIQNARGRLGSIGNGQFALRKVEGRIEDLGAPDPRLVIQGQGDGPLDDLMRFLAISPVGEWTGGALTHARAGGTGAMQLALNIPLDHTRDTTLKGQVTLTEKDQASLRLSPSVPQFSALRGTVAITETQLAVQARTRVWGQETVVQGSRGSDGVIRFGAQGQMSGEGLRQAHEYPVVARLAQHFSGETPFRVGVTIGAQTEVQVSSTLQGLASNLPAPLNKAPAAVWPLTVTHRLESGAQQDALIVELGNPQSIQQTTVAMPWLRVDYRRDVAGEQAWVKRGAISLIQPGQGGVVAVQGLPAKGVTAQVVTGPLDLDAWLTVGRQVLDLGDGAGTAPVHAAVAAAAESYVPDSLTLRSPGVTLHHRVLKDLSATLAHPQSGVWRLQLSSQQAAGQIEWLPETAPLAQGPAASRVVARLSRLSVPRAEAQALQEQATTQMLQADARTLPALDVVIDQFDWGGLPLGRIEVEALNRLVPVAGGAALPEWRLTRMRLSAPEAELDASGSWTALGAQAPGGQIRVRPRSAFGFTLTLHNSGNLLGRLGLPQTVKGGKGKITGQVNWLGSPLEPDPATMSGDLNVQISEGQFLKVEPGVAKLLGVLSLQSLPRRLTLDFRDLFQQGFAFDGIDGDVRITQGVATTRNLRMRGVQAVVLMEGQADLAQETQNLHVFVVPQINVEGASLAYAAINPVVGLSTFLAQVLLRKQVAEVGTQEFRVTGSWDDPQVEKVTDLVTKLRKPF